jgi:aspartyl-tRNA(Asn)/glutamyl-tRNA(Gln) amidotransferase subunit A
MSGLGDIHKLSARALAKAIREKQVSSVEATGDVIARLKAAHEVTHCLIALEADAALAAAKTADAALGSGTASGALHGVPLAHKDMFDRAGRIASWGAKIRADKPAGQDATVIARFKSAGAIQAAALHLTEFAFGPTGHNYILGHARNPWDPSRVTGGSSAGTAAAVASGAITVGLGSDTAGSLRLPAANCGVASIKPTWGRVSRAGAMPLAACFDCLGTIARHVEDLALSLGVIAGADPRDASAADVPVPDYLAALERPVKGLRVGIDETLIGAAHPDMQALLQRFARVLETIGMKRTKASFGDWPTIDHLAQAAQFPDAASAHAGYLMSRPDDYSPQVRARLEFGFFIPAVDHQTALRARGTMLRRVLDTTFAHCDVALLPVNADPLPTIAELDVAGSPKLQATMARVVKFTRFVNYLGLPALTLPIPREGGLPNGMQLVARPYHEALLFAIGAAYQREVPPEIATRLDV